MNANATSLVGRYVAARAEVQMLIELDATSPRVDRAIVEESEAEIALLQHVKLATGQDASRTVSHPIAASMEGQLVVVAPDPACDWDEIILVIHRRDIACGE